MTLKKSFRNNAFYEMLKFTFKKNFGFTLVATLGALLMGPFRRVNELFERNITLSEIREMAEHLDSKESLSGLALFLSILVGVFFIFLVLYNFSYLFKKSSSDAFHAFPLKRSELVIAKFVPTFLLSLVPLFCGFAGELIVNAVCTIPVDYSFVATTLGYIISVVLLCGGFTLIFAVSSGTPMDSIFFMFAIGGGLPLFVVFCNTFASETLYGYSHGETGYSAMSYTSPYVFAAYNLYNLLDEARENPLGAKWYVQLICALLGVIFVAISIFLYNRRKSEKAGEPYAFRVVPYINTLIISFASAIILGLIFAGGVAHTLTFWIFALIGALLSAAVYGAIVSRGFKKVKKALLTGGVSYLLVILVYLIYVGGGFGFETRVPSQNQIESVTVSFQGESITFKENEIDLVTALHKDFIAAKGASEQTYNYVTIEYDLKNGSEVNRGYRIRDTYGQKTLFDIYKSQTRIDSVREIIEKASKDDTKFFSFHYYGIADGEKENYYEKKLEEKDFTTLANLYEKEIRSISFEDFSDTITDYQKEYRLIDINTGVIEEELYYHHQSFRFYIYDAMTETIAFLENLPNVIEE